jgi:hypothetical protein
MTKKGMIRIIMGTKKEITGETILYKLIICKKHSE